MLKLFMSKRTDKKDIFYALSKFSQYYQQAIINSQQVGYHKATMRITSLGMYNPSTDLPPKQLRQTSVGKRNKTEEQIGHNPKYAWVTLHKVNKANNITILKLCTSPKDPSLPSLNTSNKIVPRELNHSQRLTSFRAKKMKRYRTQQKESLFSSFKEETSSPTLNRKARAANMDVLKKYSSKNHLTESSPNILLSSLSARKAIINSSDGEEKETQKGEERQGGRKLFRKLKSKLVVNNFLRIKYRTREGVEKSKLNELLQAGPKRSMEFTPWQDQLEDDGNY